MHSEMLKGGLQASGGLTGSLGSLWEGRAKGIWEGLSGKALLDRLWEALLDSFLDQPLDRRPFCPDI